MKVLVVGGGGREHALVRAIAQSPEVETIYALPGNGGMAGEAMCVPVAATDIEGIVSFARAQEVDFAVVAPDDPLVLGATDALRAAGIACFGPSRMAARIEGSKSFAKALMQKYGIPTARFAVYDAPQAALAALREAGFPVVIKADGLALGKGVVIAQDYAEAAQAVRAMMTERQFGDSGSRVVVEECLAGPEVSVLAFTDGKTIVPMVSSMDHKRALDGDLGPNTGGMGVVAPNPYYTDALARRCMDEIFRPTVDAMRAEGCPFSGCLYFGLMLTDDGPKVIEYNCRFGDPEAQAVLPLLETDLLEIMRAVEAGTLAETPVAFRREATCCLMLVSEGYPGPYAKGKPIAIGALGPGVQIYHSGTALRADGTLVTAGGRVLGICARAATIRQAVSGAYEAARAVSFEGMAYRTDIGKRAMEVE